MKINEEQKKEPKKVLLVDGDPLFSVEAASQIIGIPVENIETAIKTNSLIEFYTTKTVEAEKVLIDRVGIFLLAMEFKTENCICFKKVMAEVIRDLLFDENILDWESLDPISLEVLEYCRVM